jgi:hypothetical protein
MIISRSFFIEQEMFQKTVVENIPTHSLCSVTFFPPKIVPFMRYAEKYCRAALATGDNITRNMHIASWILKATNTHSEYIILVAFALQQLLHDPPKCYI